MKVLVISSMYLTPNKDVYAGFIHRQVMELSKSGVEIRVICPMAILKGRSSLLMDMIKFYKPAKTLRLDNIPVTYLPYWNIPHWFSVRLEIASHYLALYRYVKSIQSNFNFDLIHAHRLFPTGYVAMLIARKFGVPFVASARGSDIHTNPLKNSGISRYTKATIMMSDQILSVSEALAEELVNFEKPEIPVKVIYNGVDLDKFKPIPDQHSLRKRLGLPEGSVGVCTVCRLVKEKGLLELLQAFEEITYQHPNVWLAIVGNGPFKKELKLWVQKRSLEKHVFFAGACPNEEVVYWLNAANIFTLASYNEGLPNVILEAMACARPVVATNVGGIPEAVIDRISAFLVPPRQIAPLVESLSKLIQCPELQIQMGKAGFEHVRNNYMWSQNTKTLVSVYNKLTVSKRHN